jgi:hypothetical protein
MCHIIMAAAVAHHRGVRNEDDMHSLSLSLSLAWSTCLANGCSACARVQNSIRRRRSPLPLLAHPSSTVTGCKRRGGGRFAVARTHVALVRTACLCPQCRWKWLVVLLPLIVACCSRTCDTFSFHDDGLQMISSAWRAPRGNARLGEWKPRKREAHDR